MAFSSASPTAKVADGRLILKLPDAETPALWIMDVNDAAASVIRLESDRQGFYVLKKHGGKGVAETIAVYRDRDRAGAALDAAARALEKARDTRPLAGPNARPVIIRKTSLAGRIFVYFVLFWFLLWMTGFDRPVLRTVLTPFYRDQIAAYDARLKALAAQQQAQQTQAQAQTAQPPEAQPQAASPADTTGVPMSADDFLKSQTAGPQ